MDSNVQLNVLIIYEGNNRKLHQCMIIHVCNNLRILLQTPTELVMRLSCKVNDLISEDAGSHTATQMLLFLSCKICLTV